MPSRAHLDQFRRDVDRVVIAPGQIFNGARDRLMETVRQFRGFGNWHRAAVEISGALIEDPLEHESDGNATRGHRRSDTRSCRYRQFNQRIETTKPPALRLIQELTLEVHRRQVDYRFGQ